MGLAFLPRSRNDFSPSCLFFVVWTFVGCFFAMQLFVGVVVEQFNSIRSMKDGSATMTVEQKQMATDNENISLHEAR